MGHDQDKGAGSKGENVEGVGDLFSAAFGAVGPSTGLEPGTQNAIAQGLQGLGNLIPLPGTGQPKAPLPAAPPVPRAPPVNYASVPATRRPDDVKFHGRRPDASSDMAKGVVIGGLALLALGGAYYATRPKKPRGKGE